MSAKQKKKQPRHVTVHKPKLSKIEKASIGSKDLRDVHSVEPPVDKIAEFVKEDNKNKPDPE